MKPIFQSIIGSGEQNAPAGTCMRAALASIFECQESDMRPFECQKTYSGSEWGLIMVEDLDRLGFEYHGLGKPEEIKDYLGIDGYCLAYGPSPRGFKRGHAVVFYKGEMAHDPHPSGDGLIELKGFYKIAPKRPP